MIKSKRRFFALLCIPVLLVSLLLGFALCNQKSDGKEEIETVNPPAGANKYVYEDRLTVYLPEEFKPFATGDKKALAAFNNGKAQFYIKKCLPADTGTSESYFDDLTASAYGELVLHGTENYDMYAGHNKNSAGFLYKHEGDTPETTYCYCNYYIKDSQSGCFWLVECRFTAEYADEYTTLFQKWDQYFVLCK